VLLPLLQNNLLETTESIEVVYLDASVSGPTDPDSVWTNDANAFDGSTATSASTSTTGSATLNELKGQGHSAVNAAYNNVIASRVRVYADVGALGTAIARIYEADEATALHQIVVNTGPGWTSYTALFEPQQPGWTQTDFDELFGLYYLGSADCDIFRHEIEWTYRSDCQFDTVYYFDASDEGPTDTQAVWTNDSSAFDSDTGVSRADLAVGNNGSDSNNALSGGGTNAPGSGGEIVCVYAAVPIIRAGRNGPN
jgi:hypothetical protein